MISIAYYKARQQRKVHGAKCRGNQDELPRVLSQWATTTDSLNPPSGQSVSARCEMLALQEKLMRDAGLGFIGAWPCRHCLPQAKQTDSLKDWVVSINHIVLHKQLGTMSHSYQRIRNKEPGSPSKICFLQPANGPLCQQALRMVSRICCVHSSAHRVASNIRQSCNLPVRDFFQVFSFDVFTQIGGTSCPCTPASYLIPFNLSTKHILGLIIPNTFIWSKAHNSNVLI